MAIAVMIAMPTLMLLLGVVVGYNAGYSACRYDERRNAKRAGRE